MCWVGKCDVKIAKRDFYVYKLGYAASNGFRSLYQNFIYVPGIINKKVKLEPVIPDYKIYKLMMEQYGTIYEGYHSYKDIAMPYSDLRPYYRTIYLGKFAEGRVIECRTKPSTIKGSDVPNDWTEMKEIEFWNNIEYRVKPEQKYRPFMNAKECWQEMQKHQPIGWIKSKEATEDIYFTITGLTNGTCGVMLNSPGGWSLSGLFDYYTFADGTPFGVKEEE